MGMVTKYSEIVLSIKYRERNDHGDWVGGPMYYIKNGMGKHWKWLGSLFCLFAMLASFGIGNGAQANSIVGSIYNAITTFVPSADNAHSRFLISLVCGVIMAFLVALILFGGIKRIGAVTEKLIPFMSLLYILFTLIVIGAHAGNIGKAFQLIFASAFTPEAILGAGSGILLKQTIIWGMRRSAFSNEAGLGSAAIAHAAADTDGPVHQGVFGIFEVFVDTIVICSLSGLTILVTAEKIGLTYGADPWHRYQRGRSGHRLRQQGRRADHRHRPEPFRPVHGPQLGPVRHPLLGVPAGHQGHQALSDYLYPDCHRGRYHAAGLAWNIADTLNGLMSIPNLIGVLVLTPVVVKTTKEFFANKKQLK